MLTVAALAAALAPAAVAQDNAATASYITPFPEADTYRLQVYGDAFAEGLLAGLIEAFAGDNRVQIARKHRSLAGIARQDFDDRSYPERLLLQIAFLDAHPDVGVVGGAFVQVDEIRGERFVRALPTEHGAILAAMARYIPIVHTLATFRRRA